MISQSRSRSRRDRDHAAPMQIMPQKARDGLPSLPLLEHDMRRATTVLQTIAVCCLMLANGCDFRSTRSSSDASESRHRSKSLSGFSPAFHGDEEAVLRLLEANEGHQERPSDLNRIRSLPALGGERPSVVIGPDDRKRVSLTTTYPARAVVLITSNQGRCSGVFVGRNTVLTAGHCIHTRRSGGWHSQVVVYPARNGANAPFGSCAARNLMSVRGWTLYGDADYDFGAIKLDCNIGDALGWFGFWWQGESLLGTTATIAGYPERSLEQWIGSENTHRETATRVFYKTDTSEGNSGSGVYSPAGATACQPGPCVYAVHAYGSFSGNSGPRMTKAMFGTVASWSEEP